jgi:quercetin dioxygenase-like cupin family protein
LPVKRVSNFIPIRKIVARLCGRAQFCFADISFVLRLRHEFVHDACMQRTLIGFSFAVFLLAALALGQKSTEPVSRVTPEQLKWVNEPDGLGFRQAVVAGDPSKPGIYVIHVRFPPGVMSRPHMHREDRYATVIRGTWYTGEGTEFAPDKTVALKPGSFMKHPAGTPHFDGAKDEEVILQLVGIGPSQTTRVRPELGLFAPSVKK